MARYCTEAGTATNMTNQPTWLLLAGRSTLTTAETRLWAWWGTCYQVLAMALRARWQGMATPRHAESARCVEKLFFLMFTGLERHFEKCLVILFDMSKQQE